MKKKSNTSKLREKNIIVVIVVIVLTLANIIVSYIRMSRYTEQRCLERMQEAVDSVITDMGNKLSRDSNMLNAIAEILSKEDDIDIESIANMMSNLSPLMVSKSISVLMPGDVVVSGRGKEIDANGKLSFENEAKLGEHVTDRMTNITDENDMLIRHFVPVVKDGKTVALVYATSKLSEMPDSLNISNIYYGSADIYIIDRKTGDFIMDTRHDELGNIYQMEERITQGPKSFSDAREEIINGKSDYVVIRSKTTDELEFFYYGPLKGSGQDDSSLSENEWSVAVTVPQDEALANLYRIRGICFWLAGIEIVVLVAYFIWSMRNTKITLEKAVLEERLIKAENAERAKTMFLSNMSHDIRTPMNAIIGYTTLAASNIENKERIRDYLSKILSSSNHLLSLINDILDMSRIESGRVDIEETECSLPDVLHDLRNILLSQMHSKQLDFYIDTIDVIDEDVYCDKLHLNQVLLNLLSNAIKFTPAGGSVSLIIKQLHGAPEGYASYEMRVKDTGIGMSEEFIRHVFEPFERENNSTVSGIQGTGLGMAIAKNIIDMMGGKINVKSEQGKGTEFILTLDFRLVGERKQVEVIKELEGLRALVVDDDYNICDSVTKMLVQLGLRADWTMSGREAVLHAKQAKELADDFSAYIIDWQMPDLNGIEVVRRIRYEIGEDIPIIILTAYDWSEIENEAREAGVTAFCTKPIFLSTLRDTLHESIGKVKPKDVMPAIPEVSVSVVGKRILLVEDNEINCEIASEILTSSGILIETAKDGAQAVEMVSKSKPGYYDLILMDVQMPIMNGYEATRKIRNLEDSSLSSIPIIAMTANAFNEDKAAAIESGMNDHVAKPFDVNTLFETIEKYI